MHILLSYIQTPSPFLRYGNWTGKGLAYRSSINAMHSLYEDHDQLAKIASPSALHKNQKAKSKHRAITMHNTTTTHNKTISAYNLLVCNTKARIATGV
jgi:hypothetical protein